MQVVKELVVGFDFASPHLPSLSPRHCSPLFCPRLPRTCRLLRIIFRNRAENRQSDRRARADRSRGIVLSLPAALPPVLITLPPSRFPALRGHFLRRLACRGIMEVEVRSAGCLSIHLTRQSSHLPLSEGFIMRGRPRRAVSKGRKDGKASLEKGPQ